MIPNLNTKDRRNKKHAVVEDKTSSGHKRISCQCGATFVKQPYMTAADWTVGRRDFLAHHK